ncbi:MAG: hypothetical protein KDC70_05840, partial [Saprospiraceae bacterium]|nr:hypothetical protein [Saprospiraceae bacterium]
LYCSDLKRQKSRFVTGKNTKRRTTALRYFFCPGILFFYFFSGFWFLFFQGRIFVGKKYCFEKRGRVNAVFCAARVALMTCC